MNVHLRDTRDFFVSLKLTIALLVFAIVLVFAATLDQVHLGIWAVQEKYFRTFVVYTQVGGLTFPAFPGGYTIGGLLLANLIAAHAYRFKLGWQKAGIVLTHLGLILLLVGELLSGLWQQDYHLRLEQGQTKNFAESSRFNELAIVDVTAAQFDDVVAIPESLLAGKEPLQHAKLPFRVVPKTYYPNSILHVRPENGPPAQATAGFGTRILAAPQPMTFQDDERNLPVAFVEFVAPDRSLGTYLVSMQLEQSQEFEYGGRRWRIALRPQRAYYPFSLTLLRFSHDRYPGTEIPKNFSSQVRIANATAGDDREVLISMNNPLRYAGLAFYQAGFENNDRTTVLQVVRNPSWLLPYIACGLMAAGLVGQFGIHLFAFARRRRANGLVAADAPRQRAGRSTAAVSFALLILATTLGIAPTFRAPRNSGAFDTLGFARLPTLANGRVKPLDTVARTSLLLLQGRQRVATPAGPELSPGEWLLDMLYRPERADTYQVFEIVHPDMLGAMALDAGGGAGGKRFAMEQLKPRLRDLDRQAKLAQATEAPVRTPYQRAAIKLRDRVLLYQGLQSSVNALGSPDFFGQVLRLPELKQAVPATADGIPAPSGHDSPEAKTLLELGTAFRSMDAFAYLHLVPPRDPVANPADWKTAGAAWSEAIVSPDADESIFAWARLGEAWQEQRADAFNRIVAESHARLVERQPATMRRVAIEARFNAAQPFYTSMALYVGGFLFAVFSWLRWPQGFQRAAGVLVGVAFVVTTAGILTRMWLENRPPVTNLYSSALFVGWGAVALCLVLESVYRHAIAVAAAGLIGFGALLIAHHLALGGDTLEMMRAVLDSNFWLATHVVTVTIGYAATFLAGFLGIIYVCRGRFTRSLDRGTADALTRMIYGVVCFATLFSFVGTVLGGIWADQSWGRFWGWDPKENGALLIVVWNAVILHARWAGLVRQRGLAVMAIFGNVVTAWSWFGVNMLGIGLHSYGFMDAAFWWLVGFAASQALLIAIAAAPLADWRSFRVKAATVPPGEVLAGG